MPSTGFNKLTLYCRTAELFQDLKLQITQEQYPQTLTTNMSMVSAASNIQKLEKQQLQQCSLVISRPWLWKVCAVASFD